MEVFNDSDDWREEELPPEIELVCRGLQIDAALSASHLANTWYVRETAELRDSAVEVTALATVLLLDKCGMALPPDEKAVSSPVPIPDSVQAKVAPALANVRKLLPFAESQVLALHDAIQRWDTQAERWQAPLSNVEHELMAVWHGFLRDSYLNPARPPVSVNAQLLHDTCVKLYRDLTDILGGPPDWMANGGYSLPA
jgi:hypothetical protein